MITVNCKGLAGVIRHQGCSFEMAIPVAVCAPEALAISGERRLDVELKHRSPI